MIEKLEDKRARLTKQIKSYEVYRACLVENADAVMTAIAENDFCKVQKIFEHCGVPEDQRKKLMRYAIDAYEQRYDIW